ncbi:MAG: MmgE/PrpD family protein [Betaproteobacteria bacterium]|nr:MmgE/PrpD family protein [Betaproteobacteria bacterium]
MANGSMDAPVVGKLLPFVTDLRLNHLPAEVVHDLKLRILDTLGICFATHKQPYAQAVTDLVRSISAPGNATVVAMPGGFAAPGAAFANGVLSHGAEMDDCHIPSITHAGSTSLPAVLAVGEEVGASGSACLEAAAIAYELLPRVSFAVPGRFHDRGLQTTSMCAPLVNALAAGKLMGLDRAQLVNAAGLAGALAGGLRTGNDDGSWTKRLFGGWAAQTGVIAAQLAGRGFTGPAQILEGRFGLFRAHLGDIEWNRSALTAGLGEVWETLKTSYRRYPCSFGLHATIECCLKLKAAHRVDPARIAKVECRLPKPAARWWFEPEDEKRRPPTSYAAMFSIPYVAAAALVRGEITVRSFGEDMLHDRDILATIDKAYWTPDEETPFPGTMPGWVVLHMSDGARLEARQIHEPGSPQNPIPEEELFRKFEENARGVLSRTAVDRLWARVMELDTAPDVRDVLREFRGNPRQRNAS